EGTPDEPSLSVRRETYRDTDIQALSQGTMQQTGASRRSGRDTYDEVIAWARTEKGWVGERTWIQRLSRYYYNVQKLEERYAKIEQLIARLDRGANERRAAKAPPEDRRQTFQEKMFEERSGAFDAQRAASEDGAKLRTIELDRYNPAFTHLQERSYHL